MEAWELMVAASDLGKKRGTNKRIEELNPDKRMEPHQVVLEGKKLRHGTPSKIEPISGALFP